MSSHLRDAALAADARCSHPEDSKRIRVLRVIARLNIGGPAVHATLLTERLDPSRHDSLLVAGTEEPSEGNYLELQGKSLDRLFVLPVLGREIRGLHDVIALGRLMPLMRRGRRPRRGRLPQRRLASLADRGDGRGATRRGHSGRRGARPRGGRRDRGPRPPGDPAALTNAMHTLLADRDRRRVLGVAGRHRVAKTFTVERRLGDMDRVYTQLLRRKLGWAPFGGDAAPMAAGEPAPGKEVSVIVVNWNVGPILVDCMRAVTRGLTTVDGDCIVVDNGSARGDMDPVRHEFPSVPIIANARNLGFARAANQGIRESRAPYVMLLNPDAFPMQGTLEHLVRFMDRHPEVAVVGPHITNTDGTAQGSARAFPGLWTAFFGRTSFLTRYFPRNPWSRRHISVLGARGDVAAGRRLGLGRLHADTAPGVGGHRRPRRSVLPVLGGRRLLLAREERGVGVGGRLRSARLGHPLGGGQQPTGTDRVHRRLPPRRLYRKHVTRSAWHPMNTVAMGGLLAHACALIVSKTLVGRGR